MTELRNTLSTLLAGCALALTGCQSAGHWTPAVLSNTDAQTLAELKTVLAEAVNRAEVELGPANLLEATTFSILPPRLSNYEDRSTATPIQFDLVTKNTSCAVINRETGEIFPLSGIGCYPAER